MVDLMELGQDLNLLNYLKHTGLSYVEIIEAVQQYQYQKEKEQVRDVVDRRQVAFAFCTDE